MAQAVRQKQDQKAITPQTSLQAIKTLVSTAFNSVIFLRGILPLRNFSDGFVNGHPPSQHDWQSEPRSIPGKSILRGFSEAGDKLLDYLEQGIFDALEKHYLKSFMIAIYMDANDPTNIIEAFTFSFSYHTVQSGTVIPIMTTGSAPVRSAVSRPTFGLGGRNLNAQEAMLNGRVPTTREVKASLDDLVRRLLLATQQLDSLPAERYITFKLFYVDGTPEDYQPPMFVKADAEKDRFYFATHDALERPQKIIVGNLDAHYHCVDLSVSSITSMLPRQGDDLDDLPFNEPPSLSTGDHVERDEAAIQREDAQQRRVLWNAEGRAYTHESLCDGEGELDPEFAGEVQDLTEEQPVGIRCDDGKIVSVSSASIAAVSDNALHAGSQENDRDFHVQRKLLTTRGPTVEATQRLQKVAGQHNSTLESFITTGMNTMNLNNDKASGLNEWPMDVETPLADASSDDTMHPDEAPSSTTSRELRPRPGRLEAEPLSKSGQPGPVDEGEGHCCCQLHLKGKKDTEERAKWCECEGPCKRWYHIWCMGYNSVAAFQQQFPDTRRSSKRWLCFECKLQQYSLAALLEDREKQEIVTKFVELARFRLILKLVIQTETLPEGPGSLRKRLGCSTSIANALWLRLEKEGIIMAVKNDVAATGRGDKESGAANALKQKQKQKAGQGGSVKWIIRRIRAKEAIVKYFDASPKMEEELMGLRNLRHNARMEKKRKNPYSAENTASTSSGDEIESQTQLEENIPPPLPVFEPPRRHSLNTRTYSHRPNKRMKVSLARESIGSRW